jgi:opacity protein-like surface antigen
MQKHISLIRCVLLGTLISLAHMPAPAWAQPPGDRGVAPLPPEPEGFTLTPFLASSFGGDLQSSPATFGAALGYGANQRITLEAELGVAPNARQGQILEVDTSFWTLSGNVLYHFSRENFTPYAAVGLGLVSANPDLPLIDEQMVEGQTTSFAFNFGGGVKAALNERFGLRGDIRYINANGAAPDHWRLYGGLVIRRLGQWQ